MDMLAERDLRKRAKSKSPVNSEPPSKRTLRFVLKPRKLANVESKATSSPAKSPANVESKATSSPAKSPRKSARLIESSLRNVILEEADDVDLGDADGDESDGVEDEDNDVDEEDEASDKDNDVDEEDEGSDKDSGEDVEYEVENEEDDVDKGNDEDADVEEEDEEEAEEEEEGDLKVKGNKRGRLVKRNVLKSKGLKIKVEEKAVVVSNPKAIKVEGKKRKKNSELEDEKPLKKKGKVKVLTEYEIKREEFLKKYPGLLCRTVPASFFQVVRDSKVNMKKFMYDIGFSSLHSVKIDTLPMRLGRFVVRAFKRDTFKFELGTGSVDVTPQKVHDILGLPIGGRSLFDLPERSVDDDFVKLWLSQFANDVDPKKKKIFPTDIANKLVSSTSIDFMFKVNFLMLFANLFGKASTMRAVADLTVVRRIREDIDISKIDWCDFIHRCLLDSFEPNTTSGFYNGPLCFLIILYLDSTKYDRFPISRSRPAIKNWTSKNMSTRQELEIDDLAFGTLELHDETEPVEEEGFFEGSSNDKKIICEMIEEKLSSISNDKDEVENLLRDAKKDFPNDSNVQQLFERYKGLFKKTVSFEEAAAQKRKRVAKPKEVEKEKPAEKAKDSEKPKSAEESVSVAIEKPMPAEKQKPVGKSKLADKQKLAEKSMPAEKTESVVVEKPKPVAKAKPVAKPAVVNEKASPIKPVKKFKAAAKPKQPNAVALKIFSYMPKSPSPIKANEPAENLKEASKTLNEPTEETKAAGEELDAESLAQWIDENISWVGEDPLDALPRVVELGSSTTSAGFVKPDKPILSPYMGKKIDVTSRCKRVEFLLGNCLFAMQGEKYENLFQSLSGFPDVTSVRLNLETLAPHLWIDANVIDCWAALMNFEHLALGCPSPRKHFFPTRCINDQIINGTFTEEQQWESFLEEVTTNLGKDPVSMSLSEIELVFFPIFASNHFYVVVFNLKKLGTYRILDNSDLGYTYASKYKHACDPLRRLFARYLKEQNHPSHDAVNNMRAFIPKLKWKTSINHSDCGVFAMVHMENYNGESFKTWDFGLCEESDEQVSMLKRLRYKIATKILLHQFNTLSDKIFDLALEFETSHTEEAKIAMIVDAINNRSIRDPSQKKNETHADIEAVHQQK